MTTAMAEQSWLTHSPNPRYTLPLTPSNLEGELLNLEGEQPLSQSVNSYPAPFRSKKHCHPLLRGSININLLVQQP